MNTNGNAETTATFRWSNLAPTQIHTRINYTWPACSRLGQYAVTLTRRNGNIATTTGFATLEEATAYAKASDARIATILTPRPSDLAKLNK
jgi:hypothetical protein